MKRKKRFLLWAMLVILSFSIYGCSSQVKKQETTGVAMGTIVTQTVYVRESSKEDKTDITAQITNLLNDTEAQISWRLDTSDVSHINAAAGNAEGYELPENLSENFEVIWQVSKASGGAFDLTVAPVVRLWDIDTWVMKEAEELSAEIIPTKEQIKDKLSVTGYEDVAFADGKIYLPEGYMLDLGAAGKGMACDRIVELLESQEQGNAEVQGAVISLGGNILTYGSKPDGTAWKVGIVDPFRPDRYLGALTLSGTKFVTTSGDYERYVEIDGVRYHHIIDPSTGYPADSGVRSVTILSENGLIGDALSTACFVLGREKALELAKEYEVEILIVTQDGEIVMSEGMEKVFSLSK